MEILSKVLVVDDEEALRDLFRRQIEQLGYSCATAPGGVPALELLEGDDFDVALIDLIMPDMDGLALLENIRLKQLDTAVIMVSGRGTIDTAVEAMKRGAFDFLEKMPPHDSLRAALERAASHKALKRHARRVEGIAKRWDATFNAVPDLIAILDSNQRIIRANKTLADRLGRTPENLVGLPLALLGGVDAQSPLGPFTPAAFETAETIAEFLGRLLHGVFLVSMSPLLDDQGERTSVVVVARDVTEQKRAEEELRRAHSETQRLLSSMSSLLIEVDTDYRIIRWNKAAESTFGIQAADALGKPLSEAGIRWDATVFAPHSPAWPKTEAPVRLPPMRYTRTDGSDGILGLTLNAIRSDAGEALGFFLLGADITQRVMLESQLIQSQKLESIGQLAAGIAHEINTPIQYVGDNIEFLNNAFEDFTKLRTAYERLTETVNAGGGLPDEVRAIMEDVDLAFLAEQIPKAIQQSMEGVRRVAAIVHAMKEFSHPGSAEKTRVDLNKNIQSTVTVSRNEWKYVADLEMDLDADLPYVACLPGEFNQVILNIIVNAAHAIADVVGDGAHGKGKITVSTRRDGDWVEVRIRDTGKGIPAKIRDRVFDPFFTTKEVGKGTGQGLAIAHNVIVEKHGGTITFETEEGKGTVFIIRLPVESK